MSDIKKYKFIRDGKEEEVEGERWRWMARYGDGSRLFQFDDETGMFHQFREIDLDRITVLTMYCPETPNRAYDVVLGSWMKPIHYYHNEITERYIGTELQQFTNERTYCFGFEEEADGKKHKVIYEIRPDDTCAPIET